MESVSLVRRAFVLFRRCRLDGKKGRGRQSDPILDHASHVGGSVYSNGAGAHFVFCAAGSLERIPGRSTEGLAHSRCAINVDSIDCGNTGSRTSGCFDALGH